MKIDLIKNVTSETLNYIETNEYGMVQNLSTTIQNGEYIRLGNNEYILSNYSQVSKTKSLESSGKVGFDNNNKIVVIEISYNEV